MVLWLACWLVKGPATNVRQESWLAIPDDIGISLRKPSTLYSKRQEYVANDQYYFKQNELKQAITKHDRCCKAGCVIESRPSWLTC